MRRSRIVLLDEPTNALDPDFVPRFWQIIHERVTAGTAVVVTSHNLQVEIYHHAHRVLRLEQGQVQATHGFSE